MMELMGMNMSEGKKERPEEAEKEKESDSQLPFKLPKGIKLPFGKN
jgi:hypothetical protein